MITARVINQSTGSVRDLEETANIQLGIGYQSIVALDLSKDDIRSCEIQGDNLVLHLVNGETLTLQNFYAEDSSSKKNELRLLADGDEVQVDLASIEAAGITLPLPLPHAQSGWERNQGERATEEVVVTGANDSGLSRPEQIGIAAGIVGAGGAIAALAGGSSLGSAATTSPAITPGDTPTPATTPSAVVVPDAPEVLISSGTEISGAAQPNTTIELSIGSDTQTVTADSTGAFVFMPEPALADGTSVSLTAIDSDGNTSSASSTVVDAQPPITPMVTSADPEQISGTAEPRATVDVTINGETQTVRADADGNWTIVPAGAPLSADASAIIISQDVNGNSSSTLTYNIDVTAPATPSISQADANKISGSAEPNSTVTLFVAGTEQSVTADANGNWSITPSGAPLADRTSITITATDSNGNSSGAITSTVNALAAVVEDIPESVPPVVEDDTQAPAAVVITLNEPTEIAGTAEPGTSIAIDIAGTIQTTVADANGNWNITPTDTPFTQGETATATATDSAGNLSAPTSFTVESAPPTEPSNNIVQGELTGEVMGPGYTDKGGDSITAGGNKIFARAGDDVIDGGGGGDEIRAGAGDDVIIISDDFYSQLVDGTGSIHGGLFLEQISAPGEELAYGGDATDTIRFDGTDLNIDLSAIQPQIEEIEAIDITGSGDNALTLAGANLARLSTTTNELTILGDAGDSVDATGWTDTGNQQDGLDVYTNGGVTLLVDPDVTVVV